MVQKRHYQEDIDTIYFYFKDNSKHLIKECVALFNDKLILDFDYKSDLVGVEINDFYKEVAKNSKISKRILKKRWLTKK